jgi:hypothetical protein
VVEKCGKGIGNMKMARGRKFGVWQTWNSESEGGNKWGGGGGGGKDGVWQAVDRGRRERKYTCSPNLV